MSLPGLAIICRVCGHREECPPAQMLARVQGLGMLRRAASPEPELLEELFCSSVDRMKCSACAAVGLDAEEIDEPEWGDRRCEVCGRLIPDERLAVLPDAKRCVQCT